MSRSDYTTYHIETPFGHLAVHYKGNINSSRAFVFIHGHIESALENDSYSIFNKNDGELKILLDIRSHGSSTRSRTYPTISDRCEDLDTFLLHIQSVFPNLEKVHLIGYSQGGSTVLHYLLNEYKGKEMLGDTYLFAPRLDMKAYMKWFDKEIQHLNDTGNVIFDKRYSSKGILTYHKKFIDEFSDINFYDVINNLSINTYIIRGTEDHLLTRDEVDRLVYANPTHLKYVEIEGLVHTPTIDKFEMLFDLIVDLNDKEESTDIINSSNVNSYENMEVSN